MDRQVSLVSLEQAASDFLKQKVIAVFGLSTGDDDTAKSIYEKLEESGYTAVGINPSRDIVKDIHCFPDLESVPMQVEAAVVVTNPKHLSGIVEQAVTANVKWLWLHKSFGNSVDPDSVTIGRQKGLTIIDGACPMMFLEPVDGAHRCLKVFLNWFGRFPKQIPVQLID